MKWTLKKKTLNWISMIIIWYNKLFSFWWVLNGEKIKLIFFEVVHSITITVIQSYTIEQCGKKSENFSIRKLVQFMCELVFYCGLCLHSCINTKRIKWNLKRYIYRKSRYICLVFVVNEKHLWKVRDLLELQSQSVNV